MLKGIISIIVYDLIVIPWYLSHFSQMNRAENSIKDCENQMEHFITDYCSNIERNENISAAIHDIIPWLILLFVKTEDEWENNQHRTIGFWSNEKKEQKENHAFDSPQLIHIGGKQSINFYQRFYKHGLNAHFRWRLFFDGIPFKGQMIHIGLRNMLGPRSFSRPIPFKVTGADLRVFNYDFITVEVYFASKRNESICAIKIDHRIMRRIFKVRWGDKDWRNYQCGGQWKLFVSTYDGGYGTMTISSFEEWIQPVKYKRN